MDALAFDINRLDNAELLPAEDAVDMELPVYTEPEVLQLLQDFNLSDDPGIQEIRTRVQLVTWGDLLTSIQWKQGDWVRHLGERTAARLRSSTFDLTRLVFLEDFVNFLNGAMAQNEDQELGRWFYDVTPQNRNSFDKEIANTTAQRQWVDELKRALRHVIEQSSRVNSISSPGDADTDWSNNYNGQTVSEGGPNEFVPIAIMVPTPVEEETTQDGKVSNPTTTTSNREITPPTAEETKESSDNNPHHPRISSNPSLPPNISTTVPQAINGPKRVPSLAEHRPNQPPPTTMSRAESTPPIVFVGHTDESNHDEPSGDTNTNDEPQQQQQQQDENRNKYFRKFCILTAALVLNFVVAALALRFGFDFQARDFVPADKQPLFPTAAPTVGTPGTFLLSRVVYMYYYILAKKKTWSHSCTNSYSKNNPSF